MITVRNPRCRPGVRVALVSRMETSAIGNVREWSSQIGQGFIGELFTGRTKPIIRRILHPSLKPRKYQPPAGSDVSLAFCQPSAPPHTWVVRFGTQSLHI